MKIKVIQKSYSEVMALPRAQHFYPRKQSMAMRLLVKAASAPDLMATHFTYDAHGMERLGKKEPALILMNHSSFIDLKIAHKIFFPRPLATVCTSDGFIGQLPLMRSLGCIPTQKFVSDLQLVRDMQYALKKLGSSVLMYPEASYSFDGTCTPLPSSLGKLLKLLKVPVATVITQGAFARDPLYNCLQLRRVKVHADVTYLLSPEEIAQKSVEDLNGMLREVFSFDNFRWQRENAVTISEAFRADGLNRILYKCPHCGAEGRMTGRGIHLQCEACGKRYELTPLGEMRALDGETAFSHIPDWYAWERDEVRREIEEGRYGLDIEVLIRMMVDYKGIYEIGRGRLRHDASGFYLTDARGELDYYQKPLSSYSLYSDYYWYELGDMICIGDRDKLFYCFPTEGGDVVAKTRLAAEELYKLAKREAVLEANQKA